MACQMSISGAAGRQENRKNRKETAHGTAQLGKQRSTHKPRPHFQLSREKKINLSDAGLSGHRLEVTTPKNAHLGSLEMSVL